MCGNPARVELEPTGVTTTRGDHRAEVQLHHRRSGLKAKEEGVESSHSVAHYPSSVAADNIENNNCDETGVGDLECNKDAWQALMKDEAGEGGGCRGKHNARYILLVVFSVICSVVSSYALGIMLGAMIRSLSLNGGQDDAYTADNDKLTSSLLVIDTAGMSKIELSLIPFLAESSFIQDKVIDLIVNEYTVPNGVDTARFDRFDNAMEAMQLLETDGEPIQVEGYPYLFVGSIGASLNHESLHKNGITYVINWSSSAKCNAFDDIEYMCIRGITGPSELRGHLDELEKAVETIESIRKVGGRVLSHCWYGKNRSVTLLVAYLMKYEGMSASQANILIQKTRPQANPYMDVLQAYSKQYLSSNTGNTSVNKTDAKITSENNANQ